MTTLLIAVGLVILFPMLILLIFWKKLKLWQKWGIIGFLFGLILTVVMLTIYMGDWLSEAERFYIIFCFLPIVSAKKIAEILILPRDYFLYLAIVLSIFYYTLFGMVIGKSFDSGFKNKNKLAKKLFFFLLIFFVITILYPYLFIR